MFNNQALLRISELKLKQDCPTYWHLNRVTLPILADLTPSMRFPGLINGSLRKMAVNLTSFPMAHFMVPSHALLPFSESLACSSLTSDFLTSRAYSASNMMYEVDPRHGLYLSLSAAYRGSSLKTSSIEFNLLNLLNKGSSYFESWYA